MEVTCVVTLRSVRTQLVAMVVYVPEATEHREWASHVWVCLDNTFQHCFNWDHTLGLTWVLFYLSDIDECLQTPNPCAYQCRNVPGSFRCLCPPGTVLLGDGRSCAGLERGQTFTNGTRVRARLRPQLVSSVGRPILSRSHGVSRITRQSCPVGYANRDGTCVGECASEVRKSTLYFQAQSHTSMLILFFVQMWMNVYSRSHASMNAETP